MSRTITTSTRGSIRSSWIPTGNIAAPISRSPDQSLDDAQLAKKRHLAAKLLIEEGQRVLDIGSGWGGLGLYLAEHCGASVTGVTLSEEQLKLASGRATEAQLSDAVEFRLQDYRDLKERFDRIVSVGMFEHVGVGHYRTFFRSMRAAADRRRRDDAAFDRAVGRSERDQSVDRQIYLPGRLHPRSVGGSAGDRARRPARHRYRDPAPALCRDAQGLAQALHGARRGSAAGSTTTASCGCGNSISLPPRWRSAIRA